MKSKEEFFGFENHEYNPIVRSESIKLLSSLIEKHKPKQILEIGTFIGYSASVMLESFSGSFVTTIEKNKENAECAVKNLKELGFEERFEVVNADASDFLIENQNKKFDFIFLDGPKGQYVRYLPYLKNMLNEGGVLVADDILFYGLVRSQQKIDHKHRSLVNNLRKFLEVLQNDKDLETVIYDFENGMSVSVKKM